MDLLHALRALGLDERECALYETCLRLGRSSLMPIAAAVGIPRTTARYALEKLAKDGFVEVIARKSRHDYEAVSPRRVLARLDAREREAREQASAFARIVPDLLRLGSGSDFQPKVRVFQGREIRRIYEEILESGADETLFIGSMRETARIIGRRYLGEWMQRRVRRGMSTRAIRTADGETEEPEYVAEHGFLREVRTPPAGFHAPSHVILYGEHVAFITTAKEAFGTVVTSRDVAATMKSTFESVWGASRRRKG